ncbi:hypothetical protein QBC44DRAFT_323919 [Cladorrhinum sp. PSN332]|nr:hypothetical protein QBC44DRAFT_323919 [Cladorrhinum sp. PSN332]
MSVVGRDEIPGRAVIRARGLPRLPPFEHKYHHASPSPQISQVQQIIIIIFAISSELPKSNKPSSYFPLSSELPSPTSPRHIYSLLKTHKSNKSSSSLPSLQNSRPKSSKSSSSFTPSNVFFSSQKQSKLASSHTSSSSPSTMMPERMTPRQREWQEVAKERLERLRWHAEGMVERLLDEENEEVVMDETETVGTSDKHYVVFPGDAYGIVIDTFSGNEPSKINLWWNGLVQDTVYTGQQTVESIRDQGRKGYLFLKVEDWESCTLEGTPIVWFVRKAEPGQDDEEEEEEEEEEGVDLVPRQQPECSDEIPVDISIVREAMIAMTGIETVTDEEVRKYYWRVAGAEKKCRVLDTLYWRVKAMRGEAHEIAHIIRTSADPVDETQLW